MLGGPGTDNVAGDGWGSSADVVDGGPGLNTMDGDWSSRRYDAVVTPLNVTLAGGADDGRSGGAEGDDIRGVERIHETSSATSGPTGPRRSCAPDHDAETMRGNGGNDISRPVTARTPSTAAPATTARAGFGDDTIVGGPGRDRIGRHRRR